MKKRFIGILVGVVLAASLIVGCATRGRTGVFTGSSRGYGGTIVVEVTVDRGDIQSLRVIQHRESTHLMYGPAFDRVISAVLNDGNLNVDRVAGATLSFMGVHAATVEALTAAGINTARMMRPRPAHTPQNITMSADVVVIGAGGAGLAAAVTALELGSSVILVEANSIIGGNTLIAGSIMQVSGTPQQAAAGVVDNPDNHFAYTMSGGDNVNRPDLVRILVDNALGTMQWMEARGTLWTDAVFVGAGTTFPRAIRPDTSVGALGTGWVQPFQRIVEDPASNAQVLMDTRATDLIMEGGRVTGVRATGRNGNVYTLTANDGVVIATGGFAANVQMRMQYDAQWDGMLTASIPNTNLPTLQGDGIRIAQAVGANVIDMGYIQLLAFGCPQSGSPFNFAGGLFFMVNEQGYRFISENARRDDMTKALFQQTNSRMFFINDNREVAAGIWASGEAGHADRLIYYGYAYRADTIPELARMIGMDPNVLLATIEEFNRMAAGEIPCPFGRNFAMMPGGTIDLRYPPFYASPRVPTIHHTMGGLDIDGNTRVRDVNGNVIPGLYAAGEVVGGVHGTNRLGGNAITEAFVFGRIAGESAALRR
ncbi:MAG: flavocytochrome c [Treponema sp.]|jgi:fumarate reductase flavoprotein subunit|nr:flavocytochrome c [Treponema sp.]